MNKAGEALKYTIADEWLPKILGWNKSDPAGRGDVGGGPVHIQNVAP